jgi:transposase-like protein
VPFRKLADGHNLSHAQMHFRVQKEMDSLPENTWLTANHCERWSGRLVVDGKYIKVKGYKKKIPFIYGIDFLTHDIPVGILAPSENEHAYTKFFNLLKTCKYPLQIVITDEAGAIKQALKRIYPKARNQICHTHYLENIRQYLKVRTDDKYESFFFDLQYAFRSKHHFQKRNALLRKIRYDYGRDVVVQALLIDIQRRNNELFAYSNRMKHCPHTTNIIESYNSHLEARLKSIKGFQSFHSAERWLNAWMLRRRTKAFTDCGEPFKHLNGKCSLEMSIKKQAHWPEILGIKAPDMKR